MSRHLDIRQLYDHHDQGQILSPKFVTTFNDPHGSGGYLRVDGETGEGRVDPRADEALPPHPRLHQVLNLLFMVIVLPLSGEW